MQYVESRPAVQLQLSLMVFTYVDGEMRHLNLFY